MRMSAGTCAPSLLRHGTNSEDKYIQRGCWLLRYAPYQVQVHQSGQLWLPISLVTSCNFVGCSRSDVLHPPAV